MLDSSFSLSFRLCRTARGVGVIILLAGVFLLGYYYLTQEDPGTLHPSPSSDEEAHSVPSLNQRLLQGSDFDENPAATSGGWRYPQYKYSTEKFSKKLVEEKQDKIEKMRARVHDMRSDLHRMMTTKSKHDSPNSPQYESIVYQNYFANDDKPYAYDETHDEYDANELVDENQQDVYDDYRQDIQQEEMDSNPEEEEEFSHPNDDLHFKSTAESDHYSYSSHTKSSTLQSACNTSSIKSWKTGVVTELHPRIRASCDLLRSNNRPEIQRVKSEIKSWQNTQSEEEWRESLSDCESVVRDFSNNFYNSPRELEFPLVYILVVYTNPRQMVRLIKTLWRPQNLFCIHPDAKQSNEFIGVFRQLAKCLDNVFLPRKLEKVYYQHHTIMDSQMNCYEDLMTFPARRWKYVINLCGRELPLKTNREIVESLRKLNGHSAIETRRVHTDSNSYLATDRFLWKAEENYNTGKLYYTHEKLKKPPIPIYMSTNFIAATRPFVNFFLTDKKAIDFRNYLRDVKIPEEEFYASLIHLAGTPGGLPPHKVALPTIDKYIWMNKHKKTRIKQQSCEGRMVHFICILGVGDLDQIFYWGVNKRTPVFFFNKYFMEEDHVVMDCMEEWLIQQNMKEHAKDCLHNH